MFLTPTGRSCRIAWGRRRESLGRQVPPLLVGDEFHSEPRAQTMSGSLGFQGALSQALAEVCSMLSCSAVHCKPQENKAERNAAPKSSMQD